jgi:NAD(P)-dependent dehydrogenase (short-subunit alcohol dehydrogenase family)
MSTKDHSALVVGAGPGLGAALARRFIEGGLKVAVSARDGARLKRLAEGLGASAYPCDATVEAQVTAMFERLERDHGAPNLVVYNAGAFVPKSILDTGADEFERCWRIGCLGGFLVGREAAKRMTAKGMKAGGGTILFTGATASLRGGARFANLAVGKFGLRALAQSMARELQPLGVHVAHVVIDGQIAADHRQGRERGAKGEDGLLDPNAIAEAYWQLYRQPRSAWTLELDLRPWVEKF